MQAAAPEARHMRQLQLLGPEAHGRLLRARALVVGLGGLGCPAAHLLAGCGVGLRLVDHDTVDVSNLHRQGLYAVADVGRTKAEAAAARVRASFPTLGVEAVADLLDEGNADALLAGCDVALACTDTVAARYALSDACQRAGVPLVQAGIDGWQAQLAVFPPGGPCYRCLHPSPAAVGTDGSACAITGVIGPVPAVAGSLQALEAVKAVLARGRVAPGLLLWDALEGAWQQVALRARPGCPGCASGSQRP